MRQLDNLIFWVLQLDLFFTRWVAIRRRVVINQTYTIFSPLLRKARTKQQQLHHQLPWLMLLPLLLQLREQIACRQTTVLPACGIQILLTSAQSVGSHFDVTQGKYKCHMSAGYAQYVWQNSNRQSYRYYIVSMIAGNNMR